MAIDPTDTFEIDPADPDAPRDLTSFDLPSPVTGNDVAATYADPDDIATRIEVPFDAPGDIWRVVAVLRDPTTDRTIRHRVDYSPSRQSVTELEIGYVDGDEVYRRKRDGLAYRADGLVHVKPLEETMPLEEYVDVYAFDEAGWRLGAGFGEFGGVPAWDE